MNKIITLVLLATFFVACTPSEISENEFETYGTEKSKSVNSEGSSEEYELEDELDDTED